MRRYEVHNQLTGELETASTWTDAQILKQRLRNEYIVDRVDPLFQITILVENEDGSWTQSLADNDGNPASL